MALELHMVSSQVTLRRGTEPWAEIETQRGIRRMALDPSLWGERIARGMGPTAPDPLFRHVLMKSEQLRTALGA